MRGVSGARARGVAGLARVSAGRVRAATLGASILLGAGGAGLAAQGIDVRGYYLNVATAAGEGPFTSSGVSDLHRLRLMAAPAIGLVELDAAYEHTLALISSARGVQPFAGLGEARGGGEWLDLQGALEESEHVSWRHRVDRLAARSDLGAAELTLGRQPLSWATTLILTPADPFIPFDPEDPFREFRAGVDAARARFFLGPFTDLDLVLRPAGYEDGTTLTAIGRLHTVLGGWEVAGWGGAVHDEAAGAVSFTRSFAGAVARGEAVIRRAEGGTVVRLAIGVDRSFPLAGRDLYVVVEYQRDGFGAAGASELPALLSSAPFRRGELIVLGRDTAALQASYRLHPLWTADALFLWNLGDPSALIAPGLTYSLSGEATLRGGLFVGAGDERTDTGLPGSEFGAVPLIAYVSLTAFF